MNPQSIISGLLHKRFRQYQDAFIGLYGIDPMAKTKEDAVVTARCVIANELRAEGWRVNAIAAVLHKDHSTIHHYINKYEDYFSIPCYRNERDVIAHIREAVGEIDKWDGQSPEESVTG